MSYKRSISQIHGFVQKKDLFPRRLWSLSVEAILRLEKHLPEKEEKAIFKHLWLVPFVSKQNIYVLPMIRRLSSLLPSFECQMMHDILPPPHFLKKARMYAFSRMNGRRRHQEQRGREGGEIHWKRQKIQERDENWDFPETVSVGDGLEKTIEESEEKSPICR